MFSQKWRVRQRERKKNQVHHSAALILFKWEYLHNESCILLWPFVVHNACDESTAGFFFNLFLFSWYEISWVDLDTVILFKQNSQRSSLKLKGQKVCRPAVGQTCCSWNCCLPETTVEGVTQTYRDFTQPESQTAEFCLHPEKLLGKFLHERFPPPTTRWRGSKRKSF